MLTSGDGVSVVCPILNVSSTEFTVRFDVEEGTYEVFIKRGNQKKSKGKVLINFVERLDFTPDPGTTVYGIVTCDGEGVPGVVVSDVSEVTVTDEDGLYQLKSQKKWNYVFISVPSGYEVPADGVFPKFYSLLHNGKDELDRADFSLEKVDQSSYSMLFFGDMHLANRSTDHLQFQDFTDDVNDYLAANGGKKVYAATLGDMTWDYYWYNVNMPYDIDDYIQEINNGIKGLQIFHTMGNHDNDYMTLNDFDAATKYVSKIAPTIMEGAGVVTSRAHVHWVVTEYGAVNLYGRSMQERARLLTGIAHPDHREALDRAAFERSYCSVRRIRSYCFTSG